jgi:hypothetical protein
MLFRAATENPSRSFLKAVVESSNELGATTSNEMATLSVL